ncbi:hypothetical protein ACFYWP_01525 [Actinacidiphila glaucinigra]|uniref:hypothetical protein n=1 Tax=Actinacidiphila glaucinigra TaxID=235986 RepID=UPI0036C8C296
MKTSTKVILALLAAPVIFGGVVANAPAKAEPSAPVSKVVTLPDTTQAPKTKYVPVFRLPTKPCSEDEQTSRDCYWDAAKRGNGKGFSYWVDKSGHVTYLNPRLNNERNRAEFANRKRAAGWQFWGNVWGHQLCYAKVGDTSYIECFDGFKETS